MSDKKPTAHERLPGDPNAEEMVERFVRVDHAGEYGAKRIYAGQLSVLGEGEHGPILRHMAEQEEKHLKYFENAIGDRGVRPTALLPVTLTLELLSITLVAAYPTKPPTSLPLLTMVPAV